MADFRQLAQLRNTAEDDLETMAKVVTNDDDRLPSHRPAFTGRDCKDFWKCFWIFSCWVIRLDKALGLGVLAVVVDEYLLTDTEHIHLLRGR